jgi:chorismate mutase
MRFCVKIRILEEGVVMSINALRQKMDDIDNKIVELIVARLELAREIGYEKIRNNFHVDDYIRENEVLIHVGELARKANIDMQAIEGIFKIIISISKKEQE